MTDKAPVRSEIDAAGVAWVTLDRPEVHNAFDDTLIAKLTDLFTALGEDDAVRAVVLKADGKNFSAGADLNWMKRMAGYSHAENVDDAVKLAAMLRSIDCCPKPVVAMVQGAAFGGGVGLVSACDMAVASEDASFSLSEVKLGIIPSVISPYVVRAMGQRQARRYMLTAERFFAQEAKRIGLVHKVVPPDDLMAAVKRLVQTLGKNGPKALGECKQLIAAVVDKPIDDAMLQDTAERIARVRASDEGKEGVSAFLEKRKPKWIGEP